ncbi:acetyl-CoA carboxylase biotin carboxyl carrier protein [Intestinibacter bartlettii]|uniref:Biotin carboxyl carrier protein of acetyl-CoA carboxylase n=1 Tax=Intestinibacter bartlettii TaxID=261299 RepID=A0ABS6DZJ9_9FIRM|nr:acetyl-CoA carboxylase biotin carboxyl carrier protein [Intestinibacter bartlettii]MBU5336974.1 acetyl-CoA carboxylase biotin carboxyl carrier protein [Intestinibacter bartlettii]
MNFNEVKELISILDDSKLAYFEMENGDGYIKIDKSMSRDYVSNKIQNEVSTIENKEEKQDNDTASSKENITNEVKTEEGVEFIKSPIVGTFYSKSSPDAEPFIQKGDKISKGDIVCIVEAMKLMNEINAEFDCEIVEVMAQEGKMVQYGQELFKVKKL